MILRISFSLLLCLVVICPGLSAQSGGGSLDFLAISPSASSLGLSEAATTLPTGSSSMFSNPALLSVSPTSLDLTYTLWISEVTGQFGGVNYRSGHHAAALTLYHVESDRFGRAGLDNGFEVPIQYLSVAAGGASRLGPLHVGGSVHYIMEEVIEHRTRGFMFSGGVFLPLPDRRLSAGAALLNAGTMQESDLTRTPAPASFRSGLSGRIWTTRIPGMDDTSMGIDLYGDMHVPVRNRETGDFTAIIQQGIHYNLGVSATLGDLFEVRSGYRFGNTERPVSFGALLQAEPVRVSYALIPFSTGYGTAHSISLNYLF